MINEQLVVDSKFDRIQARNGLAAKNMSQMTKLLPILSMAGKREEDPEIAQARLEDRGRALKARLQEVLAVQGRLVNLVTLPLNTRRSRVKQSLLTLEGLKPISGISKPMKAVINELRSISEGMVTGVAMEDSDYSIVWMDHAVEKIRAAIQSNDKALRELHMTDEELEAQPEEELYQGFEAVLASAREEASAADIASIRDREWTVVRVPVVPMSKSGIFDAAKFQKNGIKCDNMAGYPMFRRQLVVGINKAMLDITDKERASGVAIARERVLAAATRVKRILEKKTGQRLQFVDQRPYGASGGAWFWLMPERELNAFAACCPGQRIQLLNWGFSI